MGAVKNLIYRILHFLGLYPGIYFIRSPFKIHEFFELLKGVSITPQDVILDLGCGRGLQTMVLGRCCQRIVGTDASESLIEIARRMTRLLGLDRTVEFECRKVEDYTFGPEIFDKIFSICVLEHIPHYREILGLLYRYLKRDGQIIFSVDSLATIQDPQIIEQHKQDHHVAHYYTPAELTSLLEETGYRDITVYPIFRSGYARDLFSQGVRNQFQYGILDSCLKYWKLKKEEEACENHTKGIFLVAKCRK
ncbi:MAG: class I SAM-dependent methyltransferase [bacterium]